MHIKYWPEKYIMPNAMIRKLYRLKKKEIPKWCYWQFYVSFVYILLFVVGMPLVFFMKNKALITEILLWTYLCIIGLQLTYIVVCDTKYKK